MNTVIIPIFSVKPSKGNRACLCNDTGVLFTGTVAQCYKIKQKIEKCKKIYKSVWKIHDKNTI